MSIAKTAFSALSWTALSTVFKGVIQIVQLIIVARLLGSIELGTLAMINLILAFAQIFGDAGISNALIFHKELVKKQLSQLYLVNVAFGLLVTVSLMFLAVPFEAFFDFSQLAELLILLSPIFFIRSLSQQHLAILQQQLKFDRIAKVEVFATFIGFGCMLLFFYVGAKVEAVIYGQLITASLLTVLIMLTNRELMPSFSKIQWPEIAKPVKYGLYQTGESFINHISAHFDQLLIGKSLGAEVLGIYSYTKAIVFRPAMQVINPIVNRVTFPLMVKYKDIHSLPAIYQKILSLLALVNVPMFLIMACFPETILGFIYGEEWQIHGELMRWLAIYMLIISLMNPVGTLLKATGKVKRSFWWNVVTTAIRPLIVIISISSGVIWLVKALVISQLIMFILHWIFLIRPTINLSAVNLCKTFIKPFVIFIVVSVFTWAINEYVIMLSPFVAMFIVLLGYTLLLLPTLLGIVKSIRQ